MAEKVYEKIVLELIEELKSFEIEEQFYSERNLAEYKGISKITARKIINILVEEGYLYKKNNVGAFVRKKPNLNILLFPFFDETMNFKLVYLNLNYYIDNEDIFEDSVVSRIIYLSKKEDKLVSIEEIFLNTKDENILNIFNDLNEKGIELLKKLKICQKIYAEIIPVKFAKLLNVGLNTPIVIIKNMIYDENGEMIIVIKSYFSPNTKDIKII